MTVLAGFDHVPATTAGGTYIGAPWRIVLHTTEGHTAEGAIGAYRGHGGWPHFTVDPAWRRRIQHYDLGVSARALKNVSGGVETNRANAIQIEIVGFAGTSQDFTDTQLDWLGAEVLAPIMAEVTVRPVAPKFVGTEAGTIASATAPQRMSHEVWLGFNGVCGHQHVPESDHWDPGRIDIERILAAAHPEGDDMTPDQAKQLAQAALHAAGAFDRITALTDDGHAKLRRIVRQEVRSVISPKELAERIAKKLPDLPPADAKKIAEAVVELTAEKLGED